MSYTLISRYCVKHKAFTVMCYTFMRLVLSPLFIQQHSVKVSVPLSTVGTVWAVSVSLCVSVRALPCLLTVSRLYYHSVEHDILPTTCFPTPPPPFSHFFFFFFCFSPCLCLVFEPLPVTVNLRQPLCWHRWEVNRSKWPILRTTLLTPSVSQVRAEY